MTRPSATRTFVGIGANQGDVRAAVESAMVAVAGLPQTSLTARSSLYATAPYDAVGPDFINAVVELSTALEPHALLVHLRRIESEHGRQRPYRHAPRTLDLDLLIHGDACLDTPDLIVPHPRLHQRAFVLHPLAELAPLLIIPGRGPLADWLPAVAGQRIEKLPA